MFQEDILLTNSEYCLEIYNTILKYIINAQNELNKKNPDKQVFIQYIEEAKNMLTAVNNTIGDFIEEDLNCNFQILNNYYKYLCTCILETENKQCLAELKYHLLEIIAAWKN